MLDIVVGRALCTVLVQSWSSEWLLANFYVVSMKLLTAFNTAHLWGNYSYTTKLNTYQVLARTPGYQSKRISNSYYPRYFFFDNIFFKWIKNRHCVKLQLISQSWSWVLMPNASLNKPPNTVPPVSESPNTTSYWNWSHLTFPVNRSLKKYSCRKRNSLEAKKEVAEAEKNSLPE